jgi:uncharacterized protein YbjQ (UPF0145 family)
VCAESPGMGFFDPDGGGEGSADGVDEEESLARIEAGGIPVGAELRLDSLRGPGGLFTSTLGVGEFVLLSELECVPLGQVMGASVHQVGWQYLPASAQWGGEVFCSLDRLSRAWDDARSRAFARLIEEASRLDAHAVVGVRLRRGEHDWARHTVDYLVSGTAVRWSGPSTTGGPVLSDLSGQEYWKLVRAGWAPAGLVASTAVFFVSQSTSARWRQRFSVTRNQELSGPTRGFAAARDMAVKDLRNQARATGASGIVGVRFDHRVARERVKVAMATGRQRTGLSPATIAIGADVPTEGRDKRDGIMVTIQAVGTAIRRQAPTTPSPPKTVLRLGAPA